MNATEEEPGCLLQAINLMIAGYLVLGLASPLLVLCFEIVRSLFSR